MLLVGGEGAGQEREKESSNGRSSQQDSEPPRKKNPEPWVTSLTPSLPPEVIPQPLDCSLKPSESPVLPWLSWPLGPSPPGGPRRLLAHLLVLLGLPWHLCIFPNYQSGPLTLICRQRSVGLWAGYTHLRTARK